MKTISVEQLHKLIQQGLSDKDLVIDVRSKDEHRIHNISGAENMPLEQIEARAKELQEYEHVYIHCQSGNRSGQACQRLQALGLDNIVNIEGGLIAWEEAGFKSIKHTRLPLMRQVFLTAGVLILLFSILGHLISPTFYFFPALVGLGLTYSGLSGNCLMARLLAKMPWNNQ